MKKKTSYCFKCVLIIPGRCWQLTLLMQYRLPTGPTDTCMAHQNFRDFLSGAKQLDQRPTRST